MLCLMLTPAAAVDIQATKVFVAMSSRPSLKESLNPTHNIVATHQKLHWSLLPF